MGVARPAIASSVIELRPYSSDVCLQCRVHAHVCMGMFLVLCAKPMSAWACFLVKTHVHEDVDMARSTQRYHYGPC